MKNFLLVVLFSFILSSTYEIQIKMDDYQGIRQGSTKVSYNGETAGKVKSIAEDDNGGYLVTLKIYETFAINEDMLFKVENRKLVVDLDAMEKRKIKKEEKARQLKAAEEEKARQLKAAEEEKTRQLKAAEEEKARQLKVEQNQIAKEKSEQINAKELPIEAEEIIKEEDKAVVSDKDLLKEQYDVPPKLKRKLKISAKKYKDNDPVTLKFLINKKGYVEEVSIKKSSGNAKFDAAAKKAIKKSKWHPAKKHDISVAAWHELEISF